MELVRVVLSGIVWPRGAGRRSLREEVLWTSLLTGRQLPQEPQTNALPECGKSADDAFQSISVHEIRADCPDREQAGRISEEKWRRRPDLNRGWRFCRFRRVRYLVDSPCSLVCGVPWCSLVFGRSWTEVGLRLSASGRTFARPQVEATMRRRTGPSTNRPRNRGLEIDRRGPSRTSPRPCRPSLRKPPFGCRALVWAHDQCDTIGDFDLRAARE